MIGKLFTATKVGAQRTLFLFWKRLAFRSILNSPLCTDLCKAETYQPGSTNGTHGTSGPIKVSYASDFINIAENFLEVAAAFDKERGLSDDIHAFFQADKYGVSRAFVFQNFALLNICIHLVEMAKVQPEIGPQKNILGSQYPLQIYRWRNWKAIRYRPSLYL